MNHIEVNPEITSEVVKDSIRLLIDGNNPFAPLSNFGLCFDVDDYDTFTPWGGAWSLIACDRDDVIHWMHPAVREALGKLTDDELRAHAHEAWPNEMSEAEKETLFQDIMSRARRDLQDLDARQAATLPFIADLSSLSKYSSAADAYAALTGLIASHEIDETVGWKLISIHAGLGDTGHLLYNNHVFKAYILASQLTLEAHLTPLPVFSPEFRAAARLNLALPSQSPKVEDLLLTAETIAAQALPPNILGFIRAFDSAPVLILERIQQGSLDPHPAHHIHRMAQAIGTVSNANMHILLHLIAVGNERLKKLGHKQTLTPTLCRVEVEKYENIPF